MTKDSSNKNPTPPSSRPTSSAAPWHTLPIEKVLQQWTTDPQMGLTKSHGWLARPRPRHGT